MLATSHATWLCVGVALALLAAPAGAQGATFPCSLAGIDAAVETGGGPHTLECTPVDTILVPRADLLVITGNLVLDFGGVTIDFESIARPGLYVGPTIDCTPSGCIRGATAADLSHFTLRGQVVIITGGPFITQGSAHATIRQAIISSPPSKPGGIHVTGPQTSLHLIDSTLDGNRNGVRLVAGGHAMIEGSLITNTVESSLFLAFTPEHTVSARVVNSTLSSSSAHFDAPTIRNGGDLVLENTTVVAAGADDRAYSRFNEFKLGGASINTCGGDLVSSANTIFQGRCDCTDPPTAPVSMTSLGGNVESGGDTCGFTHPTDQVNVTPEALALGPLAHDLGPTATHALLPGSVAIDAGAADCPPIDQRGVPRPQGEGCDAGAYEVEVALEVGIDIEPGNRRNAIDPCSDLRIPVAILGSVGLDVEDVDAATLAFGPDGAAPRRGGKSHRRDVNGDGFTDRVFRFRTRDTGIARGDVEACLTGELIDGTPFEACDAIRTRRRR